MSAALEEFREQASTLGLRVHPEKTKMVVVSGERKNITVDVKIGNHRVEEVEQLRLLGLQINKKMDCQPIMSQINKGARRLWFLTKLN